MNYTVRYVFRGYSQVNEDKLIRFWEANLSDYNSALESYQLQSRGESKTPVCIPKPIRREPACIALDENNDIVGLVFVVLRELDSSLNLGTHGYFQRMHMAKEHRNRALTNLLYKEFVRGFEKSKKERDPRAQHLLAENLNPGLQNAYIRKYFTKLGFVMRGCSKSGGEVWSKRLETGFKF